MKIKTELLRKTIAEIVCQNMDDWLEIDADNIVNTRAIEMIGEIQEVIKSEMDDFEVVEEIVCIFEKNEISAGSRHDFG